MKVLFNILALFYFLNAFHLVAQNSDVNYYQSEFLPLDKVLFNKMPLVINQVEFSKRIPKVDSTWCDIWECGSPFEWLDNAWMESKYGRYNEEEGTYERFDGTICSHFYKQIEYNSNSHLVLFNNAPMRGNSIAIKGKNFTLTDQTTLDQFFMYFPEAIIDEETENTVIIRYMLSADSEDSFLFEFTNDVLTHFSVWWNLC